MAAMLNPWQRAGLTPVFQGRFKLARVILSAVTVGGGDPIDSPPPFNPNRRHRRSGRDQEHDFTDFL
jgi:hypothetical protein